jgi:hypothetical protein
MTDVTGKTGLARIFFSAGVAVVLAACATQAEITSDYDRSANFAAFHTFALNQRPHVGISNPLVATRVEEDITQELQRRGYTLAADPASADFMVDFSIGARDRLDIHSYPGAVPVGPLCFLQRRRPNVSALAAISTCGNTAKARSPSTFSTSARIARSGMPRHRRS